MVASRGCVNQVSQELHHTAHHVTRHHTPLHNKATDVFAFFGEGYLNQGLAM